MWFMSRWKFCVYRSFGLETRHHWYRKQVIQACNNLPYTADSLLGDKHEHQFRGVIACCTYNTRDDNCHGAFCCVVNSPVHSVALRAIGAVAFWLLWEPWAWCEAARRTFQITEIIRTLRTPVQTVVFVSLSLLVLCVHGTAYDLTSYEIKLCCPKL